MKTYYPFASDLYKHTTPPRPSNEFNQVKVYDANEVDKEMSIEKTENERLVIDQCRAINECNEANEKVKRLEKEMEWLMRQHLYQIGYGVAKTEKEAKERFEEIMQQALKER